MPEIIRQQGIEIPTVSMKDHRDGWKKQKERTSSEPEALNFSHYKTGIENNIITWFDAKLRDLPYKYGFSPVTWQQIVDVEILKKAGVYDIEKMRTIILLNAEFNINNKLLGRRMMANGEKFKVLPREQYGGRKGMSAVTAALNKRLTMDLLRLRRQAGALCSNDSKSCYDRIVHNIATNAMRRLGAAAHPVKCMFETIQKAAHKVRTAFGDSESTYDTDSTPPLQGIGQGNGCGPAGWTAVSVPIINMMRTARFGINILTSMSICLVSFVCYAFVDDTDVVHAKDTHTSGQEILQEMQAVVDHWEGGVRATGGALVPAKSWWYLIDFVWENNACGYCS
jgi:hypothetical protein